MKRTLKRELKVPEIAEREANGTSVAWQDCRVHDAPDRLLPCVSTPVRDRGKLQGHGSLSQGERTALAELICGLFLSCLVAMSLASWRPRHGFAMGERPR